MPRQYLSAYTRKWPGKLLSTLHRRRIKTEEKAKVVAALWGTELIQILAYLAIFLPEWFEEKDEHKNNGNLMEWMLWKNGWSSGSPPYQTTTLPKLMISQKLLFILAAKWVIVTTFAFSSVCILLLQYGTLIQKICACTRTRAWFGWDFPRTRLGYWPRLQRECLAKIVTSISSQQIT